MGKQVEAFAKAGIETRASVDDVKYLRRLGKAIPLAGSAIVFKGLRQQGFSVEASLAGTAANEVTGDRIIWGGAAVGTAIEPGLGTVIVGGGAWAADQIFGWSGSAGVKTAQEYELRINGKKVGP